MSNGIGRVWAVNAEGGDEGRPNGVGPVYIENADQLGSKLPEPAAGDAGKVLGVLNSDGDVGWVVDQSGTFTQVQADWNESDSSQVSYIQNKPNLATVATSGSYADLSNKPTIPAAQVNSDWNAVSGAAQILNKPTIPTVAQSYNALSTDAMSGTAVAEAISGTGQVPSVTSTDNGKVLKATYAGGVGSFGWDAAPSGVPSTTSSDEGKVLGVTDNQGSLGWVSQTAAQVNADWNSSSGVSEILNKPTLATVATSGSYDDLTNKPSIPAAQVNSDWDAVSGAAQILNKPNLATVATSGSYADLSNKPTIPDAQVNSDWDAVSGVAQILNKPNLATVATSGSYNDLSNKPSIPAAQVNADWDAVSGVAQILNKPSLATVATTGAYSDLSGTPSLATVATSGSYADLSNKPTIPTVDQSYSASSTNAQSGTAVANAISAVKQVPSSTSADEDKVLTVNSSGNAVWATPSSVTIHYKEI